tara:strand:- start:4978 stop:5085 length:108 start_codon:yes stop_codon:yes gene_type:complete
MAGRKKGCKSNQEKKKINKQLLDIYLKKRNEKHNQ